jgi:hypothetical protein
MTSQLLIIVIIGITLFTSHHRHSLASLSEAIQTVHHDTMQTPYTALSFAQSLPTIKLQTLVNPPPYEQTTTVMSTRLPKNKSRTLHIQTAPSTNLSLTNTFPAMTLTLAPFQLPPESFLSIIPHQDLRQNSPPSPAFLICPTCSFFESYLLTSSSSTPACVKCMYRFKKHEREEWAKKDGLTLFPCLLEQHVVPREREDREQKE